jgi:hypothetical protein
MRLGKGEHTYEWIDEWGRIPNSETGRANGRTHAVVVATDGTILVFHQANPALLVFSPDGTLLGAWGDRFLGAHGMTLVEDGGTDYLWLTDQYSGEVAKTTLDGRTIMTIARPDLPAYREGKYSPTWVAVSEERFEGNGDIWVADGYGQSYVHRYDKSGRYLSSLDGTEGDAGPFKCPHGLWVDTRKAEPELYIADRTNRRIQAYDLDGHFKRVVSYDAAMSPCGFVTHGRYMYIPEAPYRARLTVLDEQDSAVCALGVNDDAFGAEGFPNDRRLLHPGKFHTPHGVAADPAGNLYVVEWIIGGRITKLAKV